MKYIVFLLLILSSACTNPQEESLLGYWDHPDEYVILHFMEDGRGEYIYDFPSGDEVLGMKYRIDFTKRPAHLDIYDVTRGPLQSAMLFGIARFEENEMIVYFKRGEDESVRPKKFDKEGSVRYRKIER